MLLFIILNVLTSFSWVERTILLFRHEPRGNIDSDWHQLILKSEIKGTSRIFSQKLISSAGRASHLSLEMGHLDSNTYSATEPASVIY